MGSPRGTAQKKNLVSADAPKVSPGSADRLITSRLESDRRHNHKKLGFALTIIAGLAVATVGLLAFGTHRFGWSLGKLSNLSQTNSIIMMSVGGGTLLVAVIALYHLKTHDQKITKSNVHKDGELSSENLKILQEAAYHYGTDLQTPLPQYCCIGTTLDGRRFKFICGKDVKVGEMGYQNGNFLDAEEVWHIRENAGKEDYNYTWIDKKAGVSDQV